jgi:hypothetical protein
MEDLNHRSTVQFVRKMRPYRLLKSGHHSDPFIESELNQMIDDVTIERLSEYTRGMYSTELHYKNFLQYVRPLALDDKYSNFVRRNQSFKRAKEAVRNDFKSFIGIKPLDSSEIDKVIWRKGSAAGWSYPGLKKRDCYPIARNNAIRALRDFDRYRDKYRFTPDKAFARSQLAKRDTPKIRHVWGRDFHSFLIEALFAQPLTEQLILHESPILIGRDIHKDLPYDMISLIRDDRRIAIGIDFSGFDSSICRQLIRDAFDILEELFVIETRRHRLIWEYIKELFTHTLVVMPDGNMYKVLVGVPSGSAFTQIIDSVVNLIIIYALQIKFTNRTFETKVLGDDSITVVPPPAFDLEEARRFCLNTGMKLSIDKSFLTSNFSDILVLGHKFYGSRVTRDEFIVLSLALFTEDPVTNPYDSAIRIASLIVDSGYNSFILIRLYKRILSKFQLNWNLHPQRPADINVPFTTLFILS